MRIRLPFAEEPVTCVALTEEAVICATSTDCLMGSTGNLPVPSGDSPDGMERRSKSTSARRYLSDRSRSAGLVTRRDGQVARATHFGAGRCPACRLVNVLFVAAVLLAGCAAPKSYVAERNRSKFVAFKDFSKFTMTSGSAPGEIVLTSPEIKPPINWNELIASWNVPAGVYLKVEACGVFPNHTTKYYTMSLWSDDPAKHPRESVDRQRDADGTVQTDTLVLKRHGAKAQVRITMGGPGEVSPAMLKYLGLSFCDSQAQTVPLEPNRAAWGKTIPVPQRRQGEYEGGGGWCSPTSLSMVLAYWSEKLHRPELNHTVPETAAGINDANMDGTGNWPFNTAYAGEYPGMRAYVTRLSDVSELEDWIAAGVPPIISVSSYLLRGSETGPDNGHLIVCVGFTETGDVVVNDPGVSVKRNMPARKVYARDRVIKYWGKSKDTVYLVYPEGAAVPKDRFGHWDHGK